MGKRRSYQGKFKPRNPHKYKGDVNDIIWRSSWELKLMNQLDTSKNVVEWASEPFPIKYTSPKDGRVHRYYVDFYVKTRTKDGKLRTTLIEVKPEYQTVPPKKGKRKSNRFLTESVTYAVNQAKWRAAKLLCEQQGWKFRVMTEKHLGIK